MQAANNRLFSALFSIVACQILFSNPACAVSVGLSDIPIYIKQGVEPNIFFSFDDSSSMRLSYVTDAIRDAHDTKRAKSSKFNKMYYDPKVTYLPAVDASGASLGDSSFTNAWNDGFNQSGAGSCTINLSTSYRPTWGGKSKPGFNNCNDIDEDEDWGGPEYAGDAEPAYYYKFDESGDGNIDNDDHYTKVVVSTDEQQNFANWYSYYRSRTLTAKTAVTLSFSRLGTGFRISRQTINNQTLTTLSKFSSETRKDFFDWISGVNGGYGTPLRTALNNVGSTLEASDDPYRDNPSETTSPTRSCRQNFHILMTDGEWNRGNTNLGNKDNTNQTLPANSHGITNYTPIAPYKDNNTDFLADVAFRYWYTDLRPDLENDVPVRINITTCLDDPGCIKKDAVVDKAATFWNPENDPATWQHLVNFTIGFGLAGDLSFPSDTNALLDGTKTWGDNHVDDLWHAAINSRGLYLSALNAPELVNSFTNALDSALDNSSTTAPVALNSGSINSDTKLFQASFNPSDWTGKLYSKRISDGSDNSTCEYPIGDVCPPEWEASCKLDGGFCDGDLKEVIGLNWNTGRKIITYKPDANPDDKPGIAFRWASLSSDQQTKLDGTDSRGENRLNYIRGDKTYEAANYSVNCPTCTFRNRNSLLGDLVNSNPTYVAAPLRTYPDSLDGSGDSTHTTFRIDLRERQGMIYVGGNDGMLHAFSSATGEESLAYVPNMVFSKLASLTDVDYSHASFVDGHLEEGDAYFDGAWHTVLVGALGYGGQGIYALDITNPSAFSEENAANIVLWEYSDANENDLGYTYGNPAIRRLNNGKWAAIFGNGYDSTATDGHVSTSGDAAIYIVDIEDGSLIKKISTEIGTAEDPTGASRPNGIAGIQPVDINNDFIVDYLYAGDLFGNVWRFDLDSNNEENWHVAFSGTPLYKARDSANNPQPITTNPVVGNHITYMGTMVYFGTGKFLGDNDITDINQQTFYAIWDRWFDNDADTTHNESDFTAFDRDTLLEQVILGSKSDFSTVEARITTKKMIDWDDYKGWYLDLTESGERVFQPPILRNNRIIFVTATPSADPCLNGGTSWLMELDATSGSRLDTSPFDYGGDSIVDEKDLIEFDADKDGLAEDVAGSGIRDAKDGILTVPAVIKIPPNAHNSHDRERKYMATSTSDIKGVDEDPDTRLKQSWREIMECGI